MQVTITNLSLAYGGVAAVEGLDLTIKDGESIVLLGQSGCGKTSTMRCIAGLEEPTGGSITIGDTTVFDHDTGRSVPSFKRNVGMVFQSYAVWPHKTVLENVTFPLRMKKIKRGPARDKAMEVLGLVGLGHLAERGASQLSGGQMQRVALARSMAMEPSVLLLDEPLSNLDARLRDDLRVELRHIQQERGLTSLYVTHDQQEALALADRIAIMQAGHITQLGTPEAVYAAPASASIARFMGVTNVFTIAGTAGATGNTIELADHPMTLDASATSPPGAASIAIRPEDIRVRAENDLPGAPAGTNTLTGTIEVRVYQGSSVRYQIAIDNGPQLDAICPAGAGTLPRGARAHVDIDPAAVLVIPDEVSESGSVPTEDEVAA
ncbi:ABC transporter ATP-binding protein [Prauserella marina]|uniref:ABC-type quaternary amine transporter n=1 Tax=Prauserella marina TaxID=530584 RepID=A0A222VQC2_9PSEU|nr:ABC transporter ATP-binding protein [Prauserella marina]ASR36119.1 ABC transporter ATP-binding protein [Prauserella marina]PWV76854.1 iron(III) transport system ATP-binding protein [Prauserella marina]SDC99081.1 iron(III) transport system ATP-binding protein [Prauserella marina]